MIRDDPRNVSDHFRYWTEDAIKADLRERCHPFSVLISNKFRDFNIGSVIRNANAFLAECVIIYGSKQYDKRGTVGAHLYTNLKHVRYEDDLSDIVREFDVVVGVDNLDGAKAIETYEWDFSKKTLMCFGQETTGLVQEIIDICDEMIYISQYGSVRSLNVGCASAITMFDYCSKLTK